MLKTYFGHLNFYIVSDFDIRISDLKTVFPATREKESKMQWVT